MFISEQRKIKERENRRASYSSRVLMRLYLSDKPYGVMIIHLKYLWDCNKDDKY